MLVEAGSRDIYRNPMGKFFSHHSDSIAKEAGLRVVTLAISRE